MASFQFLDGRPIVVFYPQLVPFVGSVATAVLLSQMIYWFMKDAQGRTKLRVHKAGEVWLAKTRHEWGVECGLSDKQVRTALETLKEFGLIRQQNFRFKGDHTGHFQLNYHGLEQMLLGATINEPFWPVSTGSSGHAQLAEKATSITELTTELTASQDSVPPEKKMKVNQILAGLKKQPQSLPMLWKSRVATLLGGFVKPLTTKETSQLKHISKALSESQAVAVVDWMLQNWALFVYAVKEAKGCDGPAEPHIGFASVHYDVAMNALTAKMQALVQSIAKPVAKTIDKPVEPAENAEPTPEEKEAQLQAYLKSKL